MLKLKLGAEILQILQILQKKEKKFKQKFPVRQIKMTQKYSSENNLCKSDTQERSAKSWQNVQIKILQNVGRIFGTTRLYSVQYVYKLWCVVAGSQRSHRRIMLSHGCQRISRRATMEAFLAFCKSFRHLQSRLPNRKYNDCAHLQGGAWKVLWLLSATG